MQCKPKLFFTVLILSSAILCGQTSVTKLTETPISASYNIESWTTENGLPQNTVTRIVQTRDNYLWIATNDGLVRFDGIKFTVFNIQNTPQLRSNRIVDLMQDSKGALWIASENCKITLYRNNQFTVINENGFIKDFMSNFTEDKYGNVWACSNDILLKFSDYKIVFTQKLNLYKDNFRRALLWDNDRLYIGGSSLSIYHHGKTSEVPLFKGKLVESIIRTKKGEVLIGAWEGIYRETKEGFKLTQFNNHSNSNFLAPLLEDAEGKIWAIRQQPLITLIEKTTYSIFPSAQLPRDLVISILQDREGNVWLGTFTCGLVRIKQNVFNSIGKLSGANVNLVYPIMQSRDGSLYMGTNGGGLKRIQGRKTVQLEDQNLLNERIGVWALCEDSKGTIWIGTYGGGIHKIIKGKVVHQTGKEWQPAKVSFAIIEDRQKNIWVGSMNGLLKYSGDKVTHFSTSDGLANNEVRCIYEDNEGTLWVGTYGGVSCYKNGKFTSYTTQNGLSCDYVRSILKDENGRVWIGTYGGGLNRLHDGKIVQLTTRNGLFDNNVSTIIEDAYGYYWMTCNRGIYKASKQELNDFAEGRSNYIHCITYNKSDGLASNECNGGCQPSSWKTKEGKLLFPTMAGIAEIDPANLKTTNRVIHPSIENILVDEKQFTPGDTITVGPDYEKIEIEFNAVTFKNPGNVRFKYKVEGLFSNWSTATEHRSALFSKIAPGVYTFKVVNCDESGVWSEKPASITIIIKAHFYETTWFYIVIGLLLAGLMALGFLYRIKYLSRQTRILNDLVTEKTSNLAEEKQRTEEAYYEMREAKETAEHEKEKAQQANFEKTELIHILTHDLKNPLNCISGAVSLIKDNPEDQEMVSEVIGLVGISSDSMTDMLKQLHEHLQLENYYLKLEISDLSIKNLVATVIGKNSVSASVKQQQILFESAMEDTVLIEADENKIYSAIDNLVSNAVKYSPFGKYIFVSLYESENSIKFSIRDEGPGLTDQDKELIFGKFQRLSAKPTGDEISTGLGLSIVKRIVELHNGAITVESEAGDGAEFIIELPKKQKA